MYWLVSVHTGTKLWIVLKERKKEKNEEKYLHLDLPLKTKPNQAKLFDPYFICFLFSVSFRFIYYFFLLKVNSLLRTIITINISTWSMCMCVVYNTYIVFRVGCCWCCVWRMKCLRAIHFGNFHYWLQFWNLSKFSRKLN